MIYKKVQYLGPPYKGLSYLTIYRLNKPYNDDNYGLFYKAGLFEIVDDDGVERPILLPSDDWEPLA
jgi:hypothetical protein